MWFGMRAAVVAAVVALLAASASALVRTTVHKDALTLVDYIAGKPAMHARRALGIARECVDRVSSLSCSRVPSFLCVFVSQDD